MKPSEGFVSRTNQPPRQKKLIPQNDAWLKVTAPSSLPLVVRFFVGEGNATADAVCTFREPNLWSRGAEPVSRLFASASTAAFAGAGLGFCAGLGRAFHVWRRQ